MSNLLLNQHRGTVTCVLDFCRNLPWLFRRAGAPFLGILEYPQPFESHPANEMEKVLEFRIRFTRKSNDRSSPECEAGDSAAEIATQIFDVCARCFASHRSQH